jgi:general nucleoside transport system permease protein
MSSATATLTARVKRSLGNTFSRSITILLSILAAVLVGSLIMLAYGVNPLMVYKALLEGALLTEQGRFITIQRATPLIFTAISSALAFRTGVFNVGVEGQFFLGAILATWVGYQFQLPTIIHLPLALFAGFVGGAAWAFIPTIMRQKLGVSEIITTIMTNYLASNLVSWLVNYPMRATPQISETPFVQPTAVLPQFIDLDPSLGKGTQANLGIFIAIALVIIMWFIFKYTKIGYEWRLVGLSSLFSEFGGMNLTKTFVGGMLISGGIAGLGGAVEILGVWRKYKDLFAVGFGFKGNLAALLGGQSIVGSGVAALFYGGMESGALDLSFTMGVPRQLIDIVVGLIIFFMAAEGMWSFVKKIKFVRSSEQVRRTTENLEV